MSIQAMAWAIEQQEVTDPVGRHVLLCLANYAGIDGSSAHPAVLRLSRDTGLCERAVRYQLRKLERAALIVRGNREIAVARIGRKDKAPLVYHLVIHSRGAPHAPRSDTGGTPLLHGGHLTTERGAPHAPNPSEIRKRTKEEVLREVKTKTAAQILGDDFAKRFKVS